MCLQERQFMKTGHTFFLTKLHPVMAFFIGFFPLYNWTQMQLCLFTHILSTTIMLQCWLHWRKIHQKKRSDLNFFKTLRRQIVIQQRNQQENKHRKTKPEKNREHSEGNCVRQKVLVITTLLVDIESISDSWILSPFHSNNWTLSELSTPWNVLIVLWECLTQGETFATAVVWSATTEKGQWRRTAT